MTLTMPAVEVEGKATVKVHPFPNAELSGGGSFCYGEESQLSFALFGEPPWSVNYTDGVDFFVLQNISKSPFSIKTR
jgi:hypothetical protein